jgi:hypothetical protein
LAKEAAEKAALVNKQTQTIMQLASIHKRQLNIEQEKQRLGQIWMKQLQASMEKFLTVKSTVVTLLVTPVKSTAKRRKELLLDAIKKQRLLRRQLTIRKQHYKRN